MDNQHKKIKGYRELSQAEIDAMNEVKQLANNVGTLIEKLECTTGLDQRWVDVAKTDLQKGFMAAVRAVAQPESF